MKTSYHCHCQSSQLKDPHHWHILNRNLRRASHKKHRKPIIKRSKYIEPSKVCEDKAT